MDITAFAVGNRDAALLIADYNAYRKQLSRQLLALRKRLGRSTNKGQKYSNKSTVTAEDVAQNPQYCSSTSHTMCYVADPSKNRSSPASQLRTRMGPCYAHQVDPLRG